MEEENLEEEEIELSEELESFINEGIESGLSEEEILAAIDENFEFESNETLEESEETPVEAYQVDMSEHVNALLAGEDLSEEFQAKATTIFEAAVKAKLEEEVSLLEQAYAETLEERVAEIMEQLSSDVDNYLNYVVEQWIEKNEVAVESALRSELTEDFIGGLRQLFAEHYIDIPEDSVNVVEELSSTVEELEAKLNEEIERNVVLTGMISESRKGELISYVCDGLTSTQAEKLKGLVESVEYTNDDQFIEKISTLRENYFPTSVKTDKVLDLVESADPKMISESNLEGPMSRYVQALGKSLPR
jgi:AcrR family transcriptional regulator